jgi:hypothetical protein
MQLRFYYSDTHARELLTYNVLYCAWMWRLVTQRLRRCAAAAVTSPSLAALHSRNVDVAPVDDDVIATLRLAVYFAFNTASNYKAHSLNYKVGLAITLSSFNHYLPMLSNTHYSFIPSLNYNVGLAITLSSFNHYLPMLSNTHYSSIPSLNYKVGLAITLSSFNHYLPML